MRALIRNLFGVCLLGVITISAAFVAKAATPLPPNSPEETYLHKCAVCHAKDGGGSTPMGKNMKVPDLRSSKVQKKSDAELREIAAKGTSRMAGYQNQLSKQEIDDLVTYTRELAKKTH